MRWPKWIPVCGVDIQIVSKELPEDIYGEFSDTAKGPIIYVKTGLSKKMRDNVIAHEIVHAWLRMSGVVDIIKHEELICNTLAPLVVQLIEEVQNG